MKKNKILNKKSLHNQIVFFSRNAFFLTLFATYLSEQYTWADDECGPALSAVCGPAGGSYASGIRYIVSNGLNLNLEQGVEIIRNPGNNADAIRVEGNSYQPLNIILADGVKIHTEGHHADGFYMSGSGPMYVDSGADFNIVVPAGTLSDNIGTYAIRTYLNDASATGDTVIHQRAGSTLTASGVDAGGIAALNLGIGSVFITTSGTIFTSSTDEYGGYGILAQIDNATSPGTTNIIQESTGHVTTNGDSAVALYSLNTGLGNATIESHGAVETAQQFSDALFAYVSNLSSYGNAIASASTTATIITRGDASAGIWALNTGLGDARVNSAAKLTTYGSESHGLWAQILHTGSSARAMIDVEGGSVTTTGRAAHGAYAIATGTASITLHPAATIGVYGAESIALYATGADTTTINIQGNATASGELGTGAAAISENGTSTITVDTTATVSGGWQQNTTDIAASTNLPAAGIVLGSSINSTLLNRGSISARSDRAMADAGRYNSGTGNLAVDNHGLLTGFMEFAPGLNELTNHAGGIVDLRHFADTDGDGVRDTKRVSVSDFGSANSTFVNSAGATVRLATVEGNTAIDTDGYYHPTTGIDNRPLSADFYSLEHHGIVQAQLTNLGVFQHAGVIDLRGPQIGNTLIITGAATAADAPGTGEFVSEGGRLLLQGGGRADNSDQLFADMLIVDSTRLGAGGPTRIQLDYDPSTMGSLTTGNGLELVEVRDATRSAANVFTLQNRIASGAYEYTLQHGGVDGDANDGNWYLRSHLNVPVSTETPETTVEIPNYRDEVPVAMAVSALGHRLGLNLLGTYHDRAGEDYTRATGKESSSSPAHSEEQRQWGRIFGETGKVKHANGQLNRYEDFMDKGPRYDFDHYGLQVGLDLHRQLDKDGTRDIAGIYLGMSHLTADVDGMLNDRAGRITMDGYSLGAYWTHMNSSRWYLDAVAQATLYNSIEARSTAGEKIHPGGWGYVASLETGYPFALNYSWNLEPQAQIIYQRILLDDTEQDSFGVTHFKNSDAVYGRLGLRLAKHWKRNNGRETSAWFRANGWHSFGADAKTSFTTLDGENPVTLDTDLGGSWAQLGVGISGQIVDDLNSFFAIDYNQSLERSSTHSVSGRIGLQYVW
jgi:outer membrane autotransporter protein